jgi:hypothetical protein
MGDAEIRHVSDTALMVAACRAMETARTDGLTTDPFARELAGERGMAIAQGMDRIDIMCFGVGIRSKFLDELVTYAVQDLHVEAVLCLGSGLDTRPWRMDLPVSLRWIEVDFPAMQEYKASIMDHHAPKCRLERIAADLGSPAERDRVFARLPAAPGDTTLMITEGLLMYLPADAVEALAAAPTRYWVMDITSPHFGKLIHRDSFQSIQNVRAEGHLDGAQILEVIRRNGWAPLRRRSYITDARAVAADRMKEFAAKPLSGQPSPPDDPSGLHLFGRT